MEQQRDGERERQTEREGPRWKRDGQAEGTYTFSEHFAFFKILYFSDYLHLFMKSYIIYKLILFIKVTPWNLHFFVKTKLTHFLMSLKAFVEKHTPFVKT